MSGFSEDGWLWEGGVRMEWLLQGTSPNVGVGGGKGRPQLRSGAKQGWGEVGPSPLGWDPRGQGYEKNLG